jgi:hypothetical protein
VLVDAVLHEASCLSGEPCAAFSAPEGYHFTLPTISVATNFLFGLASVVYGLENKMKAATAAENSHTHVRK